jgi:hypothetical protein
MGVWTVSGLFGALVGFLMFKPTENIANFKKVCQSFVGWRWYMHAASAECRSLAKQEAFWAGLSTFGLLSSFVLPILLTGDIRSFFYAESVCFLFGFEVFFVCLLSPVGIDNNHQKNELSELKNRAMVMKRRFFRFWNPVAVYVWVFVWLINAVIGAFAIIPKVVVGIWQMVFGIVVGAFRLSVTHERFTVTASSSIGAIAGFFVGQNEVILGLLGGAICGLFFLSVAKYFASYSTDQ